MSALRRLSEPPDQFRVPVLQGEARVSSDPTVLLGTVLGSCVASCLYDAGAGVGGMNHFLLAEPPCRRNGGELDLHYGVFLMEMLINDMLKRGASKSRMRAHLYGGANLHPGMMHIGTANAEFARDFLAREGIPLVRADLGGTQARRVEFRPALGQVRCRAVPTDLAPSYTPAPRPNRANGDVELF